jgi:hypothetical protein
MNLANERLSVSALSALSHVDRRTLASILAGLPDEGGYALGVALSAIVAHFKAPELDKAERRTLLKTKRETLQIERGFRNRGRKRDNRHAPGRSNLASKCRARGDRLATDHTS